MASAEQKQIMSSQTGPSSGFSLYPDLPPELRMQICRAALPDQLAPALHIYKRGCWGPRHLTETDVGYESDSADDNLVLEFCLEKLGVARFDISIAAITNEAREVTLAWASQQWGVEVQECHSPEQGRPATIFTCRFHGERDILYVPLDLWHDFFLEPANLPFELDDFLPDSNYSTRNETRRVAVPAALLAQDQSHDFRLAELVDLVPCLNILYVIVDPQPDFSCSPGSDVPWRREVVAQSLDGEGGGDWAMVWNSIARGWHIRNGVAAQEMEDGGFYQRLLEAAQELQGELGPYERDLEIRVVRSEPVRE